MLYKTYKIILSSPKAMAVLTSRCNTLLPCFNLKFEGVAFLNLTQFAILTAPPWGPRGLISFPDTRNNRIGQMVMHSKFHHSLMNTVRSVGFQPKVYTRTTTDEVGSVKIT